MVKLYKRIDDHLFYAECWVSGDTAVTHWGIVGNNGKTKNVSCMDGECLQFEAAFVKKYQKQGYVLREEIPQYKVILQLEIKNIETSMQIKDNLTNTLNDKLGWVGLGHVDGYDVDVEKPLFRKRYLRIFCVVVDLETAKSVIKSVAEKTQDIKYSILI